MPPTNPNDYWARAIPATNIAGASDAGGYWSKATVHAEQPGFVGTVARGVGAGLANIVRHPLSFAEGLIPGAGEAQEAYSHGLTPEQKSMAQAAALGSEISTAARLGPFTPATVPEAQRHAQATATRIAASPIRRAMTAGLSPEAAPLQAAEYVLAGKALEAMEGIPAVERAMGQGLRKAVTSGAALGAGFQGANEAASAVSGRANHPSQALANVIAASILGGGLGGGFSLPDYFSNLNARGKLARPLEEAEGTATPAEPPEAQQARESAAAVRANNIAAGKEAPAPLSVERRTLTPENLAPTEAPTTAPPIARYHGSKKAIEQLGPASVENSARDNLFGPGFYTTDNPEIAGTYAGAQGLTYRAGEKTPGLKFLDLDHPAPQAIRDYLGQAAPGLDTGKPLADWLNQYQREWASYMAGEPHAIGVERPAFHPNVMARIRQIAEQEGYAGFEHEGGKHLGGPRHRVRIYFAPSHDVDLTALEAAPGASVAEVPTSQIRTASEKLQYKLNYGREGAGLALTKAKRFNPQLAGVLTLMHDPDHPGDYLVVNGHQRLDLAQRTGQDSMRAQVLPAGTTFEQARAIGARINIAEGRGTAVDAAKFMRDTNTTPEQLASEGIDLSEGMAQDTIALRNLADPLFRDVTIGEMRPARGVVIGRELPDNPPAQEAIYKTVHGLETKGQSVSDAKLAEMIRIAKGSGNVTESQTDLFGTHQLEKSLAPQQADILAYVREHLGKDRRLFKKVAEEKRRLEQGGTQVDVNAASGISTGAATRIAALDANAYSAGTDTNTILKKYAQELANSPKGARAGTLQDAYREIYTALERDFGAHANLGGITPEAGPGQGNLLIGLAPTTAPAPEVKPEEPVPATSAQLEAAGQGSMFAAPAMAEREEPSVAPATPKRRRTKTAANPTAWMGPRQVGGRYLDSYWNEPYTVTSVRPDRMTVRWDDGRETTHRTPWRSTDKVLAQPEPSEIPAAPAPATAPRGTGYTELGGTLIPGAREFSEQNIVPAAIAMRDWSRATGDTIRKIIAPKAVSPEAKLAGEILTEKTSQARENIRLRHRLMAGAKAIADDWSEADRYEFLRRADTRTPQGDLVRQKIAAALYTTLDAKRNELSNLGSGALKSWMEDYFPRLWEKPEQAHEFFVGGPQRRSLSGPAHFMKRRVLGSFDEGLQAGLAPRFSNPVELVQHTLDDMDRYIAGQHTFAELKAHGYLKLFKPGEVPPAGWTRIDDRIAKRWRPISTRPELDEPNVFVPAGEWRAMEPVARILNNYAGPSLSTQLAFRGFRDVSGFANMLQLGLSAFHLATTGMTAAGSDLARGIELVADGRPIEALKAFGRGLTPGASLARDVAAGRHLFKYADDPEFRLMHPELAKDYQAYINSGANFDRSRDFRSRLWESTQQHLRDRDVIGAALRAPLAAFERLSAPLFDYLIPRAKAGAFMDLWRDSLAQHPGASTNEARDAINRITDSVDNRFGMLNYDRWQLDRRVRDSLFVLLRAPGWTVGNLREFGGGAYDLAHLKLSHRAAGALGLIMAAGWYGALYQWAHTGTWPDLSAAAHGDVLSALRNLLAPLTGRTNAAGTPERVILPGLHKDMVSMLFQAGAPLASGDVIGAAQGVGSFLGAKANPLLALARSLYLNRDFYGREIADRSASLPTQVSQMAANVGQQLMPFSRQSYERRQEEAGQRAAMESALGVMPASRYVTDTADERFLRAHVTEEPPLTPVQAAHQDEMRKLEQELRRGQRPNVQELLRTGKLTMHDLPQLLQRARLTPLESLLQRASLDDAFAAAKLAPPEHSPIYQQMLRRKLANALRTHSLSLTQAQEYADRYRALMGMPPLHPAQPPAPPSPAPTPTPMVRNLERLNAAHLAGINPERIKQVAGLSRNLRRGHTPDISIALRSGRLTMPALKRTLLAMNETNAVGMAKWLSLDDLSYLAILANPDQKRWIAQSLHQRLNSAIQRRALTPAQASDYAQAVVG